MSNVVFRTEINGKEIGFVEIAPNRDYNKFLKARKSINENDCCAITNEPLNADNGFYLTIMTHSSMPNCFVDKVAATEMGLQTALETVVANWKAAKELKHWFE